MLLSFIWHPKILLNSTIVKEKKINERLVLNDEEYGAVTYMLIIQLATSHILT